MHKRHREKVYGNVHGHMRTIRRVVNRQREYDYFLLGTAFIYGESRVVKRYANRDFWHICQPDWDRETMQAVADYRSNA